MLAENLENYPNYSKYSEYVKKIIELENFEENIRVIAGAGSGKTETLTMRIINLLLLKKAKPEEIVAFTFTEKAAKSLKTRIYQRIQQMSENEILNSLGKMYIGTIHAYCLQLLKDSYDFGNWDMLDEVSQLVYVRKYAGDLRFFLDKKHFQRDYKANISIQDRPKKFLQSYEILYNEELDLQKVEKERPKFIEKIKILEDYFKKDRVLTFGQLIKLAIENLEKNRNPVKDLKYLFVDEYQDVNKAQVHLVRLLGEDIPSLGKRTQIFVVGDPKQSIYHWRGSSLDCFLNFASLYDKKKAQTFIIPENWRSLTDIVEISNCFSDLFKINNPHLESKPQRKNKGFVCDVFFKSYEEEAQWIVKQIKELVKKNFIEYRDIAILYRSVKKSAQYLIEECKNQEIPYVLGGKVGLFRRLEIQALVKFFAWLSDQGFWYIDNEKLEGNRLVEEGTNEWLLSCKENNIKINLTNQDVLNILNEWKTYWLNEINRVFKEIKKEKSNLENSTHNPDVEQALMDDTMRMDTEDTDLSGTRLQNKRKILNFDDYFEGPSYVKMLSDLLGRLKIKELDYDNPLHAAMLANIGRFSEILNTFEFTLKRGGSVILLDNKIKDLCFFLQSNEELFEERQGEDLRYIDAVQIFTVHQAKGLEWPVVFIPWLINNTFPTIGRRDPNYLYCSQDKQPLYDVERYKAKEKDEARLFYVAMTRARNILILSRAIPEQPSSSAKKQSEFLRGLLDKSAEKELLKTLKPTDNFIDNIPCEDDFKQDTGEEFEEYSISDILHYKQCPIHYLFNNVWGYSPILRRLIRFGNSLHHCLRVLVKKTEQGLDLTNLSEMREQLNKTIELNFMLPYLGNGVNKIMQNAAYNILNSYISEFGSELNKMNSVEARLEFLEEKSILKGIADIIMESDAPDGSSTVHVRDYKTNKPDINSSEYEKQRMESFEMQLQLYSIALEKMGLTPRKADLGFLKEKKNVDVDLSEEKKKAVLKETKKIVQNIKTRVYESNCGVNCKKNCDFRDICKYHP